MAFHAELGRNKGNLTIGQTIKFEYVKQNYGNAYDPQTGIFTCPKSGLYFFAVTIMAYPGRRTDTMLAVNGASVAFTFSAGTPDFQSTGSKSVIVPLHPGDRVWLQFLAYFNNVYGSRISTLTGYFIMET